jgi:hypothetical protein
MASGGDYIRVDFATEIEPMTLRASSLGSVTRIEFTRRSETREDSHVISAFVKVCGWRPMMVTRRAGFAKSAYGSKSDVEMIVHHRFGYAAFDSPDG